MTEQIKQIAVLGSTGSIGRQTLEVIRAFPDQFRVIGLAAGRNAELLAGQINEFKPEFVCLSSTESKDREKLSRLTNEEYEYRSIEDIAGFSGVDTVVVAIGNSSHPLVPQTTPGLELNKWGNIVADPETGQTSRKGVFAGGDIVTGGATVILAAGAGKKAARAMDAYLKTL